MGSTWPVWGMRGNALRSVEVTRDRFVRRQAGPGDKGPWMPTKDFWIHLWAMRSQGRFSNRLSYSVL